MKQLVLASASPARKLLLEQAHIEFIVDASNYEEDMGLALPPDKLAMHLSEGKAKDVMNRHKDSVILAADSFVVLGDELLGKPHTKENAKTRLRTLSGKAHDFLTGYTIIDSDSGKQSSDCVRTKVYFRNLSDEEIENYIEREDVLERAGAYYIQGLGSVLVEKIEGSYSNVMGLPLYEVSLALKDFGIHLI
jgi:septum formation protein